MKTLAIETSCDDTSIWIINFDWTTFTVDNLLAYSQVKEHNEFGGVVPEIASRLHSEKIIAVLNNIWRDKIKEVDSISVTSYPWLPGSLVVWKTVASLLWEYFQKPIIHVDHIVWHVFALLLERNINEIKFPMIVLTASWWHNNIYHVSNSSNTENKIDWENKNLPINRWKFQITKIGQTLDDAAWECFDKVSRMLWWPYPWWVRIGQQAELGKPNDKFKLSRIRLSKDGFDFSFSWVKSQIYNLIKKQKDTSLSSWAQSKDIKKSLFTDQEISDIAYEFQESVVEVLAKKLLKAAIKYEAQSIWLSGWVSANDRLQEYILELLENNQRIKNQTQTSPIFANKKLAWNIQFLTPTKKIYCTDNAAMIWVAGILK